VRKIWTELCAWRINFGLMAQSKFRFVRDAQQLESELFLSSSSAASAAAVPSL
jgi:hypothetical protein